MRTVLDLSTYAGADGADGPSGYIAQAAEPAGGYLWYDTDRTPTPVNLQAASGVTIDKTSGLGIKVDIASPTFPWADLIGTMVVDEAGANSAVLATYRGGSVREYRFGAGDKIDLRYHLPHDYAPGTDIYIHVHWSHNGTAITGTGTFSGTVAATYAKGHQQASFGAEVSVTISNTNITTGNTPQYWHRIEEVQLSNNGGTGGKLDTSLLEVDGLLLVNFTLDTLPTITGGTTAELFIHAIDIHYQSTGIGTKGKAPNFYS